MRGFRLLLAAIVATVGAYTAVVIGQHGIDFLSPFFRDIAKMGWPGQFNMDFWSFLILGSIWLMWRHHFSPLGLLFGLCIFAGGAPFLSAYLLVASFQAKGDVKELLLGKRRAAA
jgi:membrane protease YdiL (CAAX protease family)